MASLPAGSRSRTRTAGLPDQRLPSAPGSAAATMATPTNRRPRRPGWVPPDPCSHQHGGSVRRIVRRLLSARTRYRATPYDTCPAGPVPTRDRLFVAPARGASRIGERQVDAGGSDRRNGADRRGRQLGVHEGAAVSACRARPRRCQRRQPRADHAIRDTVAVGCRAYPPPAVSGPCCCGEAADDGGDVAANASAGNGGDHVICDGAVDAVRSFRSVVEGSGGGAGDAVPGVDAVDEVGGDLLRQRGHPDFEFGEAFGQGAQGAADAVGAAEFRV
jgi:hypothetical protein